MHKSKLLAYRNGDIIEVIELELEAQYVKDIMSDLLTEDGDLPFLEALDAMLKSDTCNHVLIKVK